MSLVETCMAVFLLLKFTHARMITCTHMIKYMIINIQRGIPYVHLARIYEPVPVLVVDAMEQIIVVQWSLFAQGLHT